ncbi:DUF1289 domain-containing protein [Halomonas denitrificans]|uniref:DUF1289 domain-containing protein n=1 Tax=Halomonas denitrificans TaxID=370769 RepID=UPI001CD5306E|nr:DUF1289 domain-containing protein [Halomonas denitrificans]MCA0973832.1 DUF1289 domain-containing protein [Halomonas denitrificans]
MSPIQETGTGGASMTGAVLSPCVGLCSTTLGDDVCRGCQRHRDEIRDWFAMPAEERQRRMSELDALRQQQASVLIDVFDEARLEQQMRRHRIRFRASQPALSRAVELLRVGRERIGVLDAYGLSPRPGAPASAAELYAALSDALNGAAASRRQRDSQAGR